MKVILIKTKPWRDWVGAILPLVAVILSRTLHWGATTSRITSVQCTRISRHKMPAGNALRPRPHRPHHWATDTHLGVHIMDVVFRTLNRIQKNTWNQAACYHQKSFPVDPKNLLFTQALPDLTRLSPAIWTSRLYQELARTQSHGMKLYFLWTVISSGHCRTAGMSNDIVLRNKHILTTYGIHNVRVKLNISKYDKAWHWCSCSNYIIY